MPHVGLLVHDACGDRGIKRHRAALELYGDYMYELISSHEIADESQGLQKVRPVWMGSTARTGTITRGTAHHTIKPRTVSMNSFDYLENGV